MLKIKLIVQCSSHTFTPDFLVNAKKIITSEGWGHFITIPSDPDAWFLLILSGADLTSYFNISDSFKSFGYYKFHPLIRRWFSNIFIPLLEYFFLLSMSPPLILYNLSISTLFVLLILLSFYAYFLYLFYSFLSVFHRLGHSSLAFLHLFFISVFSVWSSFPFLGIVGCHFFLISRISSIIHIVKLLQDFLIALEIRYW